MNALVFLMAFAGVVLHLLMKYRNARTKKETFIWLDHLLWALISAIVMVVVIIGWDQAKVYLQVDGDLTPFLAFLLSYAVDSWIKNISTFKL